MKKLIYIALMCGSIYTLNANAAQCSLPKDCTYMDSEFSTGGTESPSYLMEVTCRMPDEKIVKYISWKLTTGGIFGAGRITAPSKITFVPGKNASLTCTY